MPLDDIISLFNLDQYYVLKIDVEGAELAVLQGAQATLQKHRPIVFCEVLHAHSEEMLTRSAKHKAAMLKLLSAHDYRLHYCETVEGRLTSLPELETFPVRLYRDDPTGCDYVFLPREIKAPSRFELQPDGRKLIRRNSTRRQPTLLDARLRYKARTGQSAVEPRLFAELTPTALRY
jgi:hypothetical protein